MSAKKLSNKKTGTSSGDMYGSVFEDIVASLFDCRLKNGLKSLPRKRIISGNQTILSTKFPKAG